MQGDKEKCLQAGMDDFISKPVDPIKLSKVLDQWLATVEIKQHTARNRSAIY